MKRIRLSIGVPLLIFLLSTNAVLAQDNAAFSDVPENHPNATAIGSLQTLGLVTGYADGTFRPDAAINRAEFTAIITRALYP